MSKAAKIGLVILVSFILIFVALAVLIKVVVTPEKVRDTLIPLAEKSLQREVAIGEIEIGIFSGVSISDLQVQKKAAGGEFIAIKTLALKYKILPLLTGKIVIDQVLLENPHIQIERFKNGEFNFSDLTGTGKTDEKAQPQASGEVGSASPLDLLVNEISITGGEISFTDQTHGVAQKLTLESLNLLVNKFALDGPFPVELSALVNGSRLAVAGNYDLARQAGDLDVRLASLDLTDFAPYYQQSLPGKLGSGTLSLDLEIQLQPQLVESKGKVQLAGLDLLLDALPDAEFNQADLNVNYSIRFEQAKQTLQLSTVQVNLNGATAAAEGSVVLAGKEPQLDLALLFNKLDLSTLYKALPSGLTKDYLHYDLQGTVDGRVSLAGTAGDGPKLLKSADVTLENVAAKIDALKPSVSGKVTYRDQKIAAQQLIVEVAEQRVNIDLQAENIFAEPVKGEFAISADQLNLNRLIPAGGEQEKPVVKRQATAAEEIGPFAIPVAMKGTLRVGKLLYKQLSLDQVRADLVLKDNVLKIEQLKSGVAGGQFAATSEVDLGVKGLRYNGQMTLDQSNLLSLVTAFVPQAEQSVSGLLQWKNNFSGRGTIPDNLLKSLQLTGVMQLQNGKITGSPLLEQLAAFLGAPELKILDFDLLESRYDMRNGLANLSGQLNSSQAKLAPQGTVGVDGSLDMKLDARLAPELMRKLGAKAGLQNALSDKDGWGIVPLAIRGTLTSPKVAVDAEALQKQAAGKVKEEATKRLLDKIAPEGSGTQEPVKKLLEGTINKLFGN